MKTSCEKCGRGLPADADARVCRHECTFCAACATEMAHRCPNCGGELIRRSSAAGG